MCDAGYQHTGGAERHCSHANSGRRTGGQRPDPSGRAVRPGTRPPIAPPQTAIPPQSPAPMQPNRRNSLFVAVVLILLTLMLLGAGSIGIYGAATGNWPWPSPDGSTWTIQHSGTQNLLTGV